MEIFGYQFMQNAILAAFLGGIACATIGVFVVLMHMPFIGVCMSHAAFAGACLASGWVSTRSSAPLSSVSWRRPSSGHWPTAGNSVRKPRWGSFFL